MDDETCVCPICGQEIGSGEIFTDEWARVSYAECPRCGHALSWLADG